MFFGNFSLKQCKVSFGAYPSILKTSLLIFYSKIRVKSFLALSKKRKNFQEAFNNHPRSSMFLKIRSFVLLTEANWFCAYTESTQRIGDELVTRLKIYISQKSSTGHISKEVANILHIPLQKIYTQNYSKN
jgi:hypothetical protein